MSKQYYSQTYYKSISGPSRIAAEVILPYLDDAIQPQLSQLLAVRAVTGAFRAKRQPAAELG